MKPNYWAEYWKQKSTEDNNNLQLEVGRTINRVPISEEQWAFTVEHILSQMKLKESDVVLDLCAGNGLLTIPLSQEALRVTAVDISATLLASIDVKKFENVQIIESDVRLLEFPENSFSKVLLYFAVQYFSEQEIVLLLEKVQKWLVKGGLFLIGDIPETGKMWNFFDNEARRLACFDSIKVGRPIIGNWFTEEFLEKAGLYAGFASARRMDQPARLINHHYRFDMIMEKQ